MGVLGTASLHSCLCISQRQVFGKYGTERVFAQGTSYTQSTEISRQCQHFWWQICRNKKEMIVTYLTFSHFFLALLFNTVFSAGRMRHSLLDELCLISSWKLSWGERQRQRGEGCARGIAGVHCMAWYVGWAPQNLSLQLCHCKHWGV